MFLTTPDEIDEDVLSSSVDNSIYHYSAEILNLFVTELQMINTKPVFKNKLKGFLSELKQLNSISLSL